MDGVQAWELLRDPHYCKDLTTEGFRSLLYRAGYSPEVIHKAALEHGWERLSMGKLL